MEYDTEAKAKWWRKAIKSGDKTTEDLATWLETNAQDWSLHTSSRFDEVLDGRPAPTWSAWYRGHPRDRA